MSDCCFGVSPVNYPDPDPDGFFRLHTLPLTTTFKFTYGLSSKFYAKISTFSVKKYLVWLISLTLMPTVWRKMTLWHQKDVLTSCANRLTPPHVRQHFLALVGFMEIPIGYARNFYLTLLPMSVVLNPWDAWSLCSKNTGLSNHMSNLVR